MITQQRGAAMSASVGFAVVACLLWGLDVLVPLLLSDFDAMTVAVARFLAYGAVSIAVLAARGSIRRVLGYGRAVLLKCLLLGAVGEFVYYFFVVLGVQLAGGPVVAVIIGTLPVTVTVCGSWGTSMRRLGWPIALLLSGIALVNLHEIDWAHLGDGDVTRRLLGAGCAVIAVVMWTWFAVANARFLRQNPEISATDWSAMLGVATFVPGLLGTPWLVADVHSGQSGTGSLLLELAVGGLVLGVVVSLLGTVFWNRASRGLPVALLGQLMVFETVASLTYVFIARGQVPALVELIGCCAALFGLFLGIRATHLGNAKENSDVRVSQISH